MITKGTNLPIFRNNLVGHSLHIFLEMDSYVDKAGLEVIM